MFPILREERRRDRYSQGLRLWLKFDVHENDPKGGRPDDDPHIHARSTRGKHAYASDATVVRDFDDSCCGREFPQTAGERVRAAPRCPAVQLHFVVIR